jgi:hypothetical protein
VERLRALRIATRLLMVATIVIFIVGGYNVVAFMGGIISPGSGAGLKLTQTPDTGDYILSLNVNPTNRGFLGVDLSTKLTIFDADGKVINSNSSSFNIPAGQNRSLIVSLTIPKAMVPGGNIQNVNGSAQIELDVRTLWNLVGFKNVLRAWSG